jgi:hypothetical protein
MTGSQVFPELWVLCMGLALCDHCSAWNLEVTPRSLEKFWTARLIKLHILAWGWREGGRGSTRLSAYYVTHGKAGTP